MMVWMNFCAERSLAFFLRLPTVGMAMSIRMAMMAITISNSIRVKPLVRARRRMCQRELVLFIGMCCPRGSGPPEADPSDKMLQRIDALGKWNAQRQLLAISF